MKTRLNKSLVAKFGGTLALAGVLAAQAAFAASSFLDVNGTGTTPPFGTTNGIVTLTGLYWTTDATGATAPAALGTVNGIQIGNAASDFSGNSIFVDMNNATSIGTGTSAFNVVATNVTVTMGGTVNCRWNSAFTWTVATGSTLLITNTGNNNGWNFNTKAATFAGGGTMAFLSSFCANGNTANTMNMPGGTLKLCQTNISNFGSAAAAAFTLTAGTLQFVSPASASNVFKAFTGGAVFSINGGTIDNLSGADRTINMGTNGLTGVYSIGGDFTFTGSSSMGFGTNVVSLAANKTVTVSANTLRMEGPVIGAFTLTKAGSGTLSLGASGSVSNGATLKVTAGTLSMGTGGSINSGGQVTVNGGTFDVSSVAGGFALASGAMLTGTGSGSVNGSVQANTGGQINLGTTTLSFGNNLTLNGGTNIYTSMSTAGPNGLASVTGNLTLSGLSTIKIGVTSIAAGRYHLITYGGTLTGTAAGNLVLVGAPTGSRQTFALDDSVAGNIDLVVGGGAANLTWVGDGSSNNWDTNTTSDWFNTGTSLSDVFFPGDLVTFNNTGSQSPAVNLVSTALTPGSVTVSSGTYTFGGSGNISGGTVLNVSGGSLTLTETGDNFSGGVNVSGGTLVIDNNSSGVTGGTAIGASGTVKIGNNDTSGVLPAGSVNNSGSLVFTRTDNTTVANVISGPGSVTESGSGTNFLTGANTYTGPTLITSGAIKVLNSSSLGATNGSVTITNGGTLDLGGNATANNLNFGVKPIFIAGSGAGGNGVIVNTVNTNQQNVFQSITLLGNATWGGLGRWDMRGGTPVLDLNGFTLTKEGPNQMSMVSLLVTNSGSIVINNGILSFETSSTFSNGPVTITVNPGGALGHFRQSAGLFTVPVTLNGGAIRDISSSSGSTNDSPITLTADSFIDGQTTAAWLKLNGVISESGSSYGIIKTNGQGCFLSATNTYTGTTLIVGGALNLTNNGSIASSKSIRVNSGTTLSATGRADGTLGLTSGQVLTGSGTVAGTTAVGSGAAVSAGTGGVGTLTQTGSALLQSGGTNIVEVSNAAGAAGTGYDKYAVSANIGVPATVGSPFTIRLVSLAAVNFNNNNNFSWGVVTGTATNVDTSVIAVDNRGFTNDLAGGTFSVNTTGGLTVAFTANHAPTIATNPATFSHQAGQLLKIKISDLAVAAGWADPDTDGVLLNGHDSLSAGGVSITHDSTYIFYNLATNANDSFNYTIKDARSYRPGDTVRTASGTINITVTASPPHAQANGTDVNNHPTLNGSGIPNFTYGVEMATNIAGPWSVAGYFTAGTDGYWGFTDTNVDVTTVPGVFYRTYWPTNTAP